MPRQKKVITEYRHYSLPISFPVLVLDEESSFNISDKKADYLHFHNCLEIGICHKGSGYLLVNGKTIEFNEGDITCIPRNFTHTTYSKSGEESKWSYIFIDTDELFKDLLPNSDFFDCCSTMTSSFKCIIYKEEHPEIHHLIKSVFKEKKEQKTGYISNIRAYLLASCIEIIRLQEEVTASANVNDEVYQNDNLLVIAPALNYIYRNYNQQFHIEFLSEMCHLSSTHFRRVFNQIVGTNPLDFINSIRINKACQFLRGTEFSIIAVSEQVGFHSVSSFNRYFTKVMGLSPREWRHRVKIADAKTEKQAILELAGWK